MHHDPSTGQRKRSPQELFGLERELWEDRARGDKAAAYATQLRRAAANIDLALDRAEGDPQATLRLQAMASALKSAREVLTAASRAAQQFGASAGPLIRG